MAYSTPDHLTGRGNYGKKTYATRNSNYRSPFKRTPARIWQMPAADINRMQDAGTKLNVYTPDVAYSHNQGVYHGTQTPDYSIRSLPQANEEFRQATRDWKPPTSEMTNDTRSMLRQIQTQQPWYTEGAMLQDLDFMRDNFGQDVGGQYPGGLTPEQWQGMPEADLQDPVTQIMNAIGIIESRGSGDYGAYNPNDPSGAFGKYQILGDNIPSWTQEALGYAMSPQQFLNDPAAQDKTARYKMQQYYNKYGSAQAVAEAWNGGEGSVGRPNAAVQQYTQNFFNAMGESGGQVSAANGGGWIMPAQGNVSSQFGNRTHPVRGTPDFHTGLDLSAAGGSAISATTGGQVLYAGYDGWAGYTVVQSDPTGQYQIRYAHMQGQPLVQPGQMLQAGQNIGYVGSTGTSTGNHLHLEVTTPGGQYVDPASLLW